MPALEITCSHVDVENVQCAARSFQIGANATPPFAVQPRDVQIVRVQNRPPAENCIPIRPAPPMACTPKGAFEPQLRCERLDLPFSGVTISEDFLERDDIAIETGENVCDAFDRRPSIDTPSFMDVVGDNPHTEILPRSKSGTSRTC